MIHSVTKRRKRKNGKLVESRNYYLRYRIGDMACDKWVSLGVTDKSVAQSKAVQFIKDLEREIAGIAPPKKLVAAASLSFADLLADYVAELATRGRDSKYVKGTETRIALVAAECRWKKLGDVSADSFMLWRRGHVTGWMNEAMSQCSTHCATLWAHGCGKPEGTRERFRSSCGMVICG